MSNMKQQPQNQQPPIGRNFGPGRRFISGQKPKNFKYTMKKLLKRLAPYKISIISALIATLGGTVFAIIGPSMAGEATTAIFEGIKSKIVGQGGIDYQLLARILMLLAALYLASSALMFLQGI